MQTGDEPVPKPPKRRKTNNVVGVGNVSLLPTLGTLLCLLGYRHARELFDAPEA
jgi:hypothetical protein